MHPFSKVSLSCENSEGSEQFPVVEDFQEYKGSAKIPVGDSDDSKLVRFVTIAREIICAMLLVKQIKK